MKLQICTEADYLRAHITVIEGETRRRKPDLHNLMHQVISILKKWIASAREARAVV